MAIAYLLFPRHGFESFEPHGFFKVVVVNIPVSWLYEATENELQGSGMAMPKNANRALKVTDFEIFRNNRLPSDFNVEV